MQTFQPVPRNFVDERPREQRICLTNSFPEVCSSRPWLVRGAAMGNAFENCLADRSVVSTLCFARGHTVVERRHDEWRIYLLAHIPDNCVVACSSELQKSFRSIITWWLLVYVRKIKQANADQKCANSRNLYDRFEGISCFWLSRERSLTHTYTHSVRCRRHQPVPRNFVDDAAWRSDKSNPRCISRDMFI